MPTLLRGQKIKLGDLSPALQLKAGIGAVSPVLSFDISCFGIDADGKLSDDRYFVFYNQKSSPEGALRMVGAQSGDSETFEIDLARLPPSIQRLVFVLTIDGEGEMKQLGSGYFRLEASGQEVARFPFAGSDFAGEKAVIVAEIYRKDVWRLAAVGQGFAGGLPALLKHFGGEEVEETTVEETTVEEAPVTAPPRPAPAFVPPPVAPTKSFPPPVELAPPVAAKAELPKVVNLKKVGSSVKIDLNKSVGEILATAQWVDNGDRNSNNDDLDLRAGILFPDGTMSIVTCSKPGSLQDKPYVFHLGDVKVASRQKPGEESMKVNAQIGQNYGGDIAIVFSIYSAIANGPVAIASLKPKMRLQYGDQTVQCELDFNSDRAAKKKFVYTYVIGLAVIRGGQIEISPGGQVSEPTSEATPWLEWDGQGGVRVTMDGPAVIKGGGKFLTGLLNAGNKKKYV